MNPAVQNPIKLPLLSFGKVVTKTVMAGSLLSMAYSASAITPAEALYERRCGGCHSIDRNRVGPRHKNVWGSKAGSVSDYNYSNSLKHSKVIWNDTTLDAWLTNPEATIAGQKMGYRLASADERKLIIEFLKDASQKR